MKKRKKVNKQSPEIVAEQLAEFARCFPQFMAEGKIDYDNFRNFFEGGNLLQDGVDRYAFSWAGRRQAVFNIGKPCDLTLVPDKAASVDFDRSANLFIEGDNLEVLKLLQRHYRGRIKMIYIDPPYNTGGDFVYKDKFGESVNDYLERIGATKDGVKFETNPKSDGRHHSNWLSMLYPRLFLARQLLREDGVIFVSIDDNEQYHLRMLMNEIFGEENFEGHIHWRRRHNQPNDRTKMIGLVAEHIISYSKNSAFFKNEGVGKVELTGTFSNPDNDPRGNWASKPWKVGSDQNGSKYAITLPNGEIVEEGWMGEESTYKALLDDDRIVFPNKGSGLPRKKYFESERREEGQCATNWWPHGEFGHNQEANDIMTDLMEAKNVFSNPKPPKLIKNLCDIANVKSNDIVMDFFAGSASTGQAVMDSNVINGSVCKFILVQIPELVSDESEAQKDGYKTIADIGKERLRRAIRKHGYKDGFKVFKLAPSNYAVSSSDGAKSAGKIKDSEKLIAANPLVKRYKVENVIYEIILKEGFSLNSSIKKKDDFYIVNDETRDEKMYINLGAKLDKKALEKLSLRKHDILVCFDSALADEGKINFRCNFRLLVI